MRPDLNGGGMAGWHIEKSMPKTQLAHLRVDWQVDPLLEPTKNLKKKSKKYLKNMKKFHHPGDQLHPTLTGWRVQRDKKVDWWVEDLNSPRQNNELDKLTCRANSFWHPIVRWCGIMEFLKF